MKNLVTEQQILQIATDVVSGCDGGNFCYSHMITKWSSSVMTQMQIKHDQQDYKY